MFSQLAVATGLGLAAATYVPLTVLLSLLGLLAGGHSILRRRHTRRAQLILTLGSSPRRRPA